MSRDLFGLPLVAPREPASRKRTPTVIRLVFLADDDSLAYADSSPMPRWRAEQLVERVRRSDHELLEVTWFAADSVPPPPDGCRLAQMPRNARVELLSVVTPPEQLDTAEAARLLRALLPVTRDSVRATIEAALGLLGEAQP